ncbi:MAG: hypothetical protein H7836_06560 [Magnetococcus sp. YQC-3]
MSKDWQAGNKENTEDAPEQTEEAAEETDGTVALPRWLAEEITNALSSPEVNKSGSAQDQSL